MNLHTCSKIKKVYVCFIIVPEISYLGGSVASLQAPVMFQLFIIIVYHSKMMPPLKVGGFVMFCFNNWQWYNNTEKLHMSPALISLFQVDEGTPPEPEGSFVDYQTTMVKFSKAIAITAQEMVSALTYRFLALCVF